jgi:hypothetical protein
MGHASQGGMTGAAMHSSPHQAWMLWWSVRRKISVEKVKRLLQPSWRWLQWIFWRLMQYHWLTHQRIVIGEEVVDFFDARFRGNQVLHIPAKRFS